MIHRQRRQGVRAGKTPLTARQPASIQTKLSPRLLSCRLTYPVDRSVGRVRPPWSPPSAAAIPAVSRQRQL